MLITSKYVAEVCICRLAEALAEDQYVWDMYAHGVVVFSDMLRQHKNTFQRQLSALYLITKKSRDLFDL